MENKLTALLLILFHFPRLHFLRKAGVLLHSCLPLALSLSSHVIHKIPGACRPFSLLLLLPMEADMCPDIKMQEDYPVSNLWDSKDLCLFLQGND